MGGMPRARPNVACVVGDVPRWEAECAARRSPGRPAEVARLHAARQAAAAAVIEANTRRRDAARQRDRRAGALVKAELAGLEAEAAAADDRLLEAALRIPNSTHPGTPPDEPLLLREIGPPRRPAGETPEAHPEIAERLGLADLAAGSRVSGHGFAYLVGDGALLEMALVAAAVQRLAARGFRPVLPPDLVRHEVSDGCGFQPRDGDGEPHQTYAVERDGLVLAATAEVPVAGMFGAGAPVMDASELPARVVAVGHAFRREAGAHGADTRGLYRLHQFSKAEMFAVCEPADDEAVFEELVALQEEFFADLGLHCRVLEMPAHDLGAPAHRKVDIEAWMPGRGAYGEVSSASRCTDYQSRRLGIRYRAAPGGRPQFAHTLNATACAVPRTIAALLEQHQQADGSVWLPEMLRPWFGGRAHLGGDAAV